jgi:hypothetical protein
MRFLTYSIGILSSVAGTQQASQYSGTANHNLNWIFGENSYAQGAGNIVVGPNQEAYGFKNILSGKGNIGIGASNVAFGEDNKINGSENKVVGKGNIVNSGSNNVVVGSGNIVSDGVSDIFWGSYWNPSFDPYSSTNFEYMPSIEKNSHEDYRNPTYSPTSQKREKSNNECFQKESENTNKKSDSSGSSYYRGDASSRSSPVSDKSFSNLNNVNQLLESYNPPSSRDYDYRSQRYSTGSSQNYNPSSTYRERGSNLRGWLPSSYRYW